MQVMLAHHRFPSSSPSHTTIISQEMRSIRVWRHCLQLIAPLSRTRVAWRNCTSRVQAEMDPLSKAAEAGVAPAGHATGSLVRVAVAQMTSTGSTDHNFETCKRLVEEAASQGCKLLFLPENFNFLGSSPIESLGVAQPLSGHFLQRYAALARCTGLWLSLGGFQERGPDPSRNYNCHVILDDQGEIRAAYRKVHLFDVDVPNGPVLMESRYTVPGSQMVVCDSPAGRLGLTVCYDLRFPELYQRLTFERGAQVLLVPSAFTVTTGEAHWEVLLRARAIECQCYVVAAAQAGRHNEKRESHGHSLVIDPWGAVVARLEDPKATGIAVADIDLGKLQSIRERMPIAEHRKLGRVNLGWG